MNEQFKGENISSPENQEVDEEARLRKELQETMNEEDRIMVEIDKVFESTPDRGEAEKIILEKWAPLMDEAVKKSNEFRTQWLEAMNESQEEFEKGLEE